MCRWPYTADEELPVVQGVGAFVISEQEDLCSAIPVEVSDPGLLHSGRLGQPFVNQHIQMPIVYSCERLCLFTYPVLYL